uniref:Ig-like domain-containing protein n=1 Tax=Knipowitschia caucasica TaxID=637954 RepID=A0AAV2KUH9_KNICA
MLLTWASVVQVNAQCGDDVTLLCAAPRPDSVDGLEWTRTDLDPYVYLLKDGVAALNKQHEAYRGRAELKDGTAALSLRNVTSKDNGKYECRYVIQGSGVSKRSIISSEPVSVVKLRVTQAGGVDACRGAEDEEDDDDDDGDKNKIRVIDEGEDHSAFMRHHYVTFGVMGAFGLVVAAITFLMVL